MSDGRRRIIALGLRTLVGICGIGGVALPAAAQVSTPPRALPVHSAWREDATAGDAAFFNLPSRAAVRAAAAQNAPSPPSTSSPAPVVIEPRLMSTHPPAQGRQELVPYPPYAALQPSGPVLLAEPPKAPLFSWKPTYIPPGAKSGVFQGSLGRPTYLPRLGDEGFGMTSLTQQFTFALPPFINGSPMLITPSITSHFTDGPGQTPVPSQLRDFELEFRWMNQVTPRLGLDLAVAPSYFGDMENDSSDAWRVTGRTLAAWNWTESVQLVAGALFLGREDWPVVPVGGVIWKPSPSYRFDILAPRPRAYVRTYACGDVEHWAYLGGEFGGNTWAVDRPGGTGGIADKLTYADLRLLLGWERKAVGGVNGRAEIGWVFDRSIEFESGFPGFDPSDTFMVRGELSF